MGARFVTVAGLAVVILAACGQSTDSGLTRSPASVPTPLPIGIVTPHPNTAPAEVAPSSGQTVIHLVSPADYVEARIRGDSRLERLADGSIRVISTRASNADQYVEWLVADEEIMPAGTEAATVVTLVCGRGSGDWWEVYGPYGSEEFEYEVTEPGEDGCWTFNESGRHTDFRVEIWLSGNAEMTISRIEFHVTYA